MVNVPGLPLTEQFCCGHCQATGYLWLPATSTWTLGAGVVATKPWLIKTEAAARRCPTCHLLLNHLLGRTVATLLCTTTWRELPLQGQRTCYQDLLETAVTELSLPVLDLQPLLFCGWTFFSASKSLLAALTEEKLWLSGKWGEGEEVPFPLSKVREELI